ncbi:MAG TPA: ester cyclase [Mycobacteriales bacterium]|nr:ester cyclase [Mycobacteriales bacterium]
MSTALTDRYYAALNSRDWAAYDELFSADAALEGPGGASGNGADAMRAFDRGFVAAASDFRLTALTVYAAGDRIAYELHATGTHDGPLATPQGDIAASGNPVSVKGVGVFEIRDGRIAAQRVYFDRLALVEQMTGALAPAV